MYGAKSSEYGFGYIILQLPKDDMGNSSFRLLHHQRLRVSKSVNPKPSSTWPGKVIEDCRSKGSRPLHRVYLERRSMMGFKV